MNSPEFPVGMVKEVLMYDSPETFVNVTVSRMGNQVMKDGSNFDEVYERFYRSRINSPRTPDKELEYINSEKENVKKALGF